MMKYVSILGSTGSIGKNALAIAKHLGKENVQVVALAVKNNIDLLEEQAKEFHPEVVAVFDEEQAYKLQKKIPNIPVLKGIEGIECVAVYYKSNLVISAMTGAIGLGPTLA